MRKDSFDEVLLLLTINQCLGLRLLLMLFITLTLLREMEGEGVERISAPIPLKPSLSFIKLFGFLRGGGFSM